MNKEELEQKINEIDISEESDGPSEKRWDPVGGNNDGDEDFPPECKESYCSKRDTSERLEMMEQEQEMLNSSLISLTTHFAQVQFRLKQIVNSPSEVKEDLLKELEEFAFRGIPDIQSNLVFNASLYPSFNTKLNIEDDSLDKDLDLKIKIQRNKQKELICQLKTQLEDLENYAYETGDADLPQSIVLERQNLIINHLKEKLNFNLEDLSKLSGDDFRWKVDCAINQIAGPLKMKEQLINQLKTQITDLERFINYLQGEVSIESLACTCACPVHTSEKTANHFKSHKKYKNFSSANMENNTSLSTIRKVVALLHMYIMSQIGYENQNSQNKKSTVVFSWRDLRTRLDIAIEHVLETLADSSYKDSTNENISYNSDSDTPVPIYDVKVTSAVRKHLAICLRDLIQHGCSRDANSISLVPFAGCFVSKNNLPSDSMHAWEIIIKYYEIKNGYRYNSSPAQKLSQSFNLDLSGKQNTSAKQSLLITIGNIIAIHSPYKRSMDSNFKAFVCAALNSKKLVVWLKLILQNQYILDNFYMPWSYAAKTSFQDAFHALDKFTSHNFDLPVDLAIQQFQNIKEAF